MYYPLPLESYLCKALQALFRPELGMGKKGEIQSFFRGVSIQGIFGWMDTQDLVWMGGLSIEWIT
jgi:hypothetical protein